MKVQNEVTPCIKTLLGFVKVQLRFKTLLGFVSLAWVSTLVPLVSQVYIYTSQAFLNAITCYEMCYP